MITIRPGAASDLPAISALAAELALHIEDQPVALAADDMQDFFFGERAHQQVAVAEQDGVVAGAITWMMHYDLHSATRRVFIGDFCVSSARRGQGMGRALLAHVVEWAREHGAKKVAWEVWPRNESAKAFYAKHGATPDPDTLSYVLDLAPTDYRGPKTVLIASR